MTLSRFSGNREAYLNKIREHIQLFVGKALNPITIGGKTVNLNLSPGYRQLLFSYDDQKVQRAYIYTEKGIKLYEPVVIGGVSIDESISMILRQLLPLLMELSQQTLYLLR